MGHTKTNAYYTKLKKRLPAFPVNAMTLDALLLTLSRLTAGIQFKKTMCALSAFSDKSVNISANEPAKSLLSTLTSTETVKAKTTTVLKTITAVAMLSANIAHAETPKEPVNSPVAVSTQVQVFSPEDQKVYEEYASKLPPELTSFALALMKGREEFKISYQETDIFKSIKEKLTKRGKYNKKNKARMLENGWNAFANQLLDGVDSKYYDDVVELAPNLSKYIYENREKLLSADLKISYGIAKVVMVYETKQLDIEYQQQKAANEKQKAVNEQLKKLNNGLNKLNGNLSKITGGS